MPTNGDVHLGDRKAPQYITAQTALATDRYRKCRSVDPLTAWCQRIREIQGNTRNNIRTGGGGYPNGQHIGSSDEFGLRAQEMPVTVHDVNATILRLIGMDHTRLTYLYQSRDMRLTDVHGENEFTKLLVG